MIAEEKVSPFPVLGNGQNFPEQKFSAENISVELKGSHYEIECQFKCDNEHIAEMVRNRRAYNCLELDCPSVPGSRKTFSTHKDRLRFTVPADEVEQEIYLTPLVVASEDINNYSPEGMHPDYEGARFHVRKNERIAVDPAGSRAFSLWNSIQSLIQFKRSDSKTQQTVVPLPTSGALLLVLPQREFDAWIGLRDTSPPMHIIIANQYVTNGLLAGILYLAQEPDCDDSWARSLRKICERKKIKLAGCDPLAAMEAMQKILERPFQRMIEKALATLKEKENDE